MSTFHIQCFRYEGVKLLDPEDTGRAVVKSLMRGKQDLEAGKLSTDQILPLSDFAWRYIPTICRLLLRGNCLCRVGSTTSFPSDTSTAATRRPLTTQSKIMTD
ncbi:hypothetical protein J6590_014159 [Homalodisca vitripennis]|nr:hypothetical protein J6590_014159 [Homalodisca vitripennis]